MSVLVVWSNPGVSTKTISLSARSGEKSLTVLISLVHDSNSCPTAMLEFAIVLMNLIRRQVRDAGLVYSGEVRTLLFPEPLGPITL